MATRVHVLTSCKSTAISEGRPRPDGKRRKALLCLGLATTDECDDGEEVSSVRLRYPKHLMSCTITLAHTGTELHTVRCLDRATAGDCRGRAVLSGGLWYPMIIQSTWACMRALGYGQAPSADETSTAVGIFQAVENAFTRIAGERASTRGQASAKQTEERGLHSVEAQTKIRSQVMLLTHGGGRPARDRDQTEGVLCRKLECTG